MINPNDDGDIIKLYKMTAFLCFTVEGLVRKRDTAQAR